MSHKFNRTPIARRVAIVGSRHITDYRKFCQTVRPLVRPSDIIVSGGADGVDSLARRFAVHNKLKLVEHLPDHELVAAKVAEGLDRRQAYGVAAGARNTLIVNDCDVMIAIPCTHSRGTMDSIAKMKRKLRDLPVGSPPEMGIHLYYYLWDCGHQD